MNHFCSSHRFPSAGVDVIDDAAARLLLGAARAVPPRCETIVVLLDHDRCGHSIISVDGTCDADAIIDVAELVLTVAATSAGIGAVILGSVRPAGTDDLDDVERWLELDQCFSSAGIDLVEWYVFGATLSRPRVLVGEPDRWAA